MLMAVAAGGCSTPRQNGLDLSGEWRIKLDPADEGTTGKWFDESLVDPVDLPGSLQEQGYGNDVAVDTPWTGRIVDRSYFNAPEYEQYRKEGNIKVPFWLNPDKHYVGVAWYQKDIRVPANWRDKTLLLELERAHWVTTLWVDGVEQGSQNSLSTPHRYWLKDLKPGKHTLSLKVDNRVTIPVGENAHSVSDHTQSNWNGIVGEMTLSPKGAVRIDDVQIYPDVADGSVDVTIALKGEGDAGRLDLQLETLDGAAVGTAVSLDVDGVADAVKKATIDAGDDVLLWSEHTPNLYRLKTTLTAAGGKEERYTNFGFRDFKRAGTRFRVNGQPIFLRGTLECCIFPLTGYPATDEAYWEKIYRTCKEFGLNHVRFHSWCPPEAAFDVADRMGIYLQVECAVWTRVGDGGDIDKWVYAEGDRILKEYGNHPSFCMLAHGNEPNGPGHVKFLTDLVDYWKGKDNRRVYTSSAGWPYIENADYWNTPDPRMQAWGGGLKTIINAQPPRSDFDFGSIIKTNLPTVSHEIGQWCVYPNFGEIEKYTGVLKAKNFEIFRQTLNDNHMGDLADDFLYASGKLQTLCYKSDIEAALRTPGFAGFQLLDLHDFPGQGTALIGVLDPFWDTKGYVTGEEYSMFSGRTVPLIRFPKMMWLNNERMSVPVEFAHFGKDPLKNAEIVWTVTSSDGKTVGEGRFTKDLPLDNCIPVGSIELSFDTIEKASQLTVAVQIANTDIKNRWNIWVYPAQKPVTNNAPYIATRIDESVTARLNDGESVLILSPKGSVLPEKGGDVAVGFSSIFWNTAWTRNQPPHTLGILCDPEHPVFSSFPTEGYSDYQWWDVVSDCDAMNLNDFPADFKPLVYLIDDWFKNRRLGILFEAKVGKGKLMVCSAGLDKDPAKYPAAAQFKQSLVEYMASPRFNPSQELQLESVRELFR
jgi:hypothetical protein